jgi:hypothetical protein
LAQIAPTNVTDSPCIAELVDEHGTRTRRARQAIDVVAPSGAVHEQHRLLELKVRCGFPLTEDLESLAESFAILDGSRRPGGADDAAKGDEERRLAAASVRAEEYGEGTR